MKTSNPTRPKCRAFLVAIKRRRNVTEVYGVLALSEDEALGLLQEQAGEGSMIEIAGTLSSRITRSLKLKPSEARLI